MPASIGINLRVTGHCRQGGRKYMEDCFSVAYQQTDDERDLEYAFFGIYDGHGGAEAAAFAKEHLMDIIVRHKSFWSDNDEDVLKAIKDGYIATHYAMWKEQEKWPKTASGLPSTAGTTASVAFIRRGKIYVGHVGDSRIILGYQEPESKEWKAKALTKDHKPESVMEMARIEQCGGKVVAKSGVPRVVWNRPRIGHKGPVRRSTMIDEIPFLAVARSLGDLWSYNSQLDEFVVSPEPDCSVIAIDTNSFRCLIFGTDGLYNMLSSQMAVHIVQQAERHNEDAALSDAPQKVWLNPSKCLVEEALGRWSTTKMRADNTTVVTVMLDPPGPPRAQVLKNRKKNYSDSGLQIVTRYESQEVSQNDLSENHLENQPNEIISKVTEPAMSCNDANVIDFSNNYANTCNSQDDKSEISCSSQIFTKNVPEMFDMNFIPQPRESLGFDPTGTSNLAELDSSDVVNTVMESTVLQAKTVSEEENIQINEISSSSMETEYQKETITNEYSQLRVTKRRNIGKTKRILNSSENFQHIKISQTQTTIESCKELDVGCCNNKILSDSNSTKTVACAEDVEIPKKIKGNTSNDEESSGVNKVVTRSKSNISYKDETAKENNTPRQKTKDVKHKTVSSTTNQIVKETRLTRKRNLESAGVLPLKKPKVQVITKPAVVRKITRQSVLNSSKATKDETAKNVQYSKSRNMNNVKLANNNVERSVNKQRTPRKTSQLMNLPPTRKRSAVEKKLPKSNETKKLDNNNKKNVMKEHRQLSIKTRSNTKSGHCHHLRRSRK